MNEDAETIKIALTFNDLHIISAINTYINFNFEIFFCNFLFKNSRPYMRSITNVYMVRCFKIYFIKLITKYIKDFFVPS